MDRITVTTTPEHFAHLKQAHLDAGYEVINEQLNPVNGLVTFQVIMKRPSPETGTMKEIGQ